MRIAAVLLTMTPLLAQEKPAYTFGTTVVNSAGLRGRLFLMERESEKLPNFKKHRPVGDIYTTTLNVWPQSFAEGFPNVADRFEWFAIEYTGKLWIERPGLYRFSLLSDDGSRLSIDGKQVIDLDGVHAAMAASGGAHLSRGVHDIKVEYFQGPRFNVALVLAVAPPGEGWRVLNMDDFKPPAGSQEWEKGKISQVQPQTFR